MNNRTMGGAVLSGVLWAVASYGQKVITPDLKAAVEGKGWKGGKDPKGIRSSCPLVTEPLP